MKTDLNYCIVLSSEQLAYLAGSKYGIDRMKILHRLIEAAVLEENDYAIKGFSTTLQVGQAILSEVDFRIKDRQEEGEDAYALSDDMVPVLSMTPQEDSDSRMEENLPNSNECRQTEVMNETYVSDAVFPS